MYLVGLIKKNLLISGILFLLALGGLIIILGHVSKEEVAPNWTEIIEVSGSEKAHFLFLEFNKEQRSIVQHANAHDFGEALYSVSGTSGVSVCDDSFDYGCSHQFLLSAVGNEGLTVIHELDEACIDKFGYGEQSCQHGIGHGLVQYFGHVRINDALEACSTLQWQGQFFGCQDGVFMEYSDPTIIEGLTETGIDTSFSEEDPYAPCNIVETRFRYACYLHQPQWWDRVSQLTHIEIESLCANLDPKYIDTCMEGIGLSAIHENRLDTKKARDVCEELVESRNQILCMAGAVWAVGDNDKKFNKEFSDFCDSLSGEERTFCIDKKLLLQLENLFNI
jgi:hypothetical protein